MKTFNMQFTERYTPFNKLGAMTLSIELWDINADECTIREKIVNQNYGSAFDEWIRIGAQSLTEEDIEYLKNVSVPKLYVHREKIEENTLTYKASLNPLEIRLVEIKFNR